MDKKNLKTRIMRASGKGCVAAVFAERSSMACVPAFMESCEAAGIKPARLNTPERPIVNQYREGKAKRTPGGE